MSQEAGHEQAQREQFVKDLSQAALRALVRLCPQEVAAASDEKLAAACAAMRGRAGAVVDQLMSDVREVPWMARAALMTAALDLAHPGVSVLRDGTSVGCAPAQSPAAVHRG